MEFTNKDIFEITQSDFNDKNNVSLNGPILDLDNQNKNLTLSPKGILGYYLAILQKMFEENNKNVIVKPFFQEDFTPNNSSPVIFINRGTLSPSLTAAPGEAYQNIDLNIPFEGINPNETKSASFLLNQQMQIRIYAANRAELEVIAYEVYKLILATSDDVLSEIFENIVQVTPPIMSSIQPSPKSSDYYYIELDWQIVFKECNILIFKEKLLKYSRLVVHDHDAKEIL